MEMSRLNEIQRWQASVAFSWYKWTFTQVSSQWHATDTMREELDDLQIFLSTRWTILLNHTEMFRTNTVEDILQVLIVFCVEPLELDFALIFPERHTLLRVSQLINISKSYKSVTTSINLLVRSSLIYCFC
jgi:cytoplasmic FMR1 interacting protein